MKRSNLLGKWWLALDKTIIWSFVTLTAIGIVLVATASPPVASRIGININHFINHHLIYVFIGSTLLLLTSSANQTSIKIISVTGFIVTIITLIAVIKFGSEIKGAKRWIHFMGFSLQPAEFAKPLFAIVNAIVLSSKGYYKYLISSVIYLIVVALLMIEPDFGMSTIITLMWMGQIVITGISKLFLTFAFFVLLIASSTAYYMLPHVKHRIDNFLSPSKGDNFQISKSLSAFSKGGLTGVGPGEGVIKLTIPDSHSDFIFAVVAEEFGLLLCLIVILIYSILIVKITLHIINMENDFAIIALFGLIVQLGSQALIHMGVNINLLPTKGMTLPFISYGGSSIIASSINLGLILALTKTQFQVSLIFDKELEKP